MNSPVKQNKGTWAVLFFACIVLFLFLTAFSLDSIFAVEHKRSEFLLGTGCEVKVYTNPLKGNKVLDEIFAEIKVIHQLMSSEIPGNDVDRINRGAGKEWVAVSKETFTVIEESVQLAMISDGAFDISLGPVIKLWNIGKDGENIPEENELENSLKLVNYRDVKLDRSGYKVKLARVGMMIDLGGIAKGYAADRTAAIIREHEISSALINLGGNIYVVGNHPKKRKWKIGILHPRPGNSGTILAFIDVADKTLVTSGDYERFFLLNNKRYHHLINPKTGFPADNNLVSVTVVGKNSMIADGLTTATFILGLQNGKTLLESIPGYEGVFVTKDKKVYTTSGLKNSFKLYVDDYEVIN